MITVDTSPTHDGIYVSNSSLSLLVHIPDEQIRSSIEQIASSGIVTDGIKTIEVPSNERQRVIKELLNRLDMSGIEH